MSFANTVLSRYRSMSQVSVLVKEYFSGHEQFVLVIAVLLYEISVVVSHYVSENEGTMVFLGFEH